MKFSIKDWRVYYDAIHILGKALRDSRPTYTDIGDYIYPVAPLSPQVQDELESDIKTLSQRCNRYLDQCHMRMPKPLWHYDRKNPETHASAPEFKYGHLVS